jgi:hypothetical protein
MTHAPTFALASLLFFLLVKQRERASVPLAFGAGVAAAGATLVRLSAAALMVPALLAVGLDARRRGLAIAALALGSTLPLVILPFWWWACFGDPTGGPYGGRLELTAAAPWNILFAPTHGLFHFHPALLFAAVGLLILVWREGARRSADWGVIGAIWLVAVALLHGSWSEWANVGGYGQRFMIDALPALAAGFAAWLARGRLRTGRVAAGVAGCLLGFVLFFAAVGGLVRPKGSYPWPQRLAEYAVLVREPPGPGTIWRALRDASFLLRGG